MIASIQNKNGTRARVGVRLKTLGEVWGMVEQRNGVLEGRGQISVNRACIPHYSYRTKVVTTV